MVSCHYVCYQPAEDRVPLPVYISVAWTWNSKWIAEYSFISLRSTIIVRLSIIDQQSKKIHAPLTFLLFSLQAYSYARTRVFKKGGTNFAYRYNGRKGNLTLWYFIFLLSPGCYCFFNQVSLVTVSLDSSTTVPDPFFSRDYVSFFPWKPLEGLKGSDTIFSW